MQEEEIIEITPDKAELYFTKGANSDEWIKPEITSIMFIDSIAQELSTIRDFCQRKTFKESELWRATKAIFEKLNLDWEE